MRFIICLTEPTLRPAVVGVFLLPRVCACVRVGVSLGVQTGRKLSLRERTRTDIIIIIILL